MASTGRSTPSQIDTLALRAMTPDTEAPLWKYRGFILGSVRREFQSRYSNSLLGALWPILQPLGMILIYTLVFSQVMQARLPGVSDGLAYSIFICSGILAWGMFAETINRSVPMFLENANLLKKLRFPRLCLPAIISLTALLNFIITLALFMLVLLATDRLPGYSLLSLPVLVALQLAFATGLGLTLGTVNVFFRDVGQIFALILQLWFWLTPIVYPLNVLPESLQPWLALNPMVGLIQAYQNVFLLDTWPQWQSLLPAALATLFFLALGLTLHKRLARDLLDEL